jgi:colanic acid biosynthesis glycosyl transferase WcaI
MRICICDYSGHPFQVQLSRELARRGNDVLHLFFSEFQTPHGKLQVAPGDPASLAIEGVSLGRPFEKYNFIKRRWQEIEIGRRFSIRMSAFQAEIIVGCNLPIDTLGEVLKCCQVHKIPFVFWQQDIYSTAIRSILQHKFGLLGRLVGEYYRYLERKAASSSDAIVVIADIFKEVLTSEFGVPETKITVLENWAPLDEILPRPKTNPWSIAHGFAGSNLILYTGTLGMKHDPGQILAVAEAMRHRPDTWVVVTSEGPIADRLRKQAEAVGLDRFAVLPFQPFDQYPDVLGSADVLISIIEADAGSFSVPSKVLSYLCAGRPIVLSAPESNLASQIINSTGAGRVVPPGDQASFIAAIIELMNNQDARHRCGTAARAYAERTFEIGVITDRFDKIFTAVLAGKRVPMLSPR